MTSLPRIIRTFTPTLEQCIAAVGHPEGFETSNDGEFSVLQSDRMKKLLEDGEWPGHQDEEVEVEF